MSRGLPRVVASRPRRPRALLVDDHPGVLNHVSTLLIDRFDVVGTATDGHEALAMVPRLLPDVVVLDINMSGLDGLQTARALRQSGSRVPAVFLSTFDGEDLVAEAIRCGGQGYVAKAHAARDLADALDHALLGRLFVPSCTSLIHAPDECGHAALLHGDGDGWLDDVAGVFDLALRRGDAACVIATEPVRQGLASRLASRGWDLGRQTGDRRYLAIDDAHALQRFMSNGVPDARVLADIAAELDAYRRAAGGVSLTIFGNMVVSLLTEGNASAAIRLEHLWNEVTRGLPFVTLCGYSTACFGEELPDLWSEACAAHGAVSHARNT